MVSILLLSYFNKTLGASLFENVIMYWILDGF